MNAYYPDGAVVVARAAKATRTLQMLSASPTVLESPKGIEDVIAARGEPVWVSATGEAMQPEVIKRIEATGCPALGVDSRRWRRQYDRGEVDPACGRGGSRPRGGFAMYRLPQQFAENHAHPVEYSDGAKWVRWVRCRGENSVKLSWDDVRRVRDLTRMKLSSKGLLRARTQRLPFSMEWMR